MKKLLLITCIILAFGMQSQARNGFTQYEKNPVITKSEGSTITVNNSYRRYELPDGDRAPDHRRFLVLDLHIQNTGKEKLSVNPLYFTLVAGDETCEARSYYWNWNRCFKLIDLRPGTGMDGMIQFEIPKSATTFKLYFEPYGQPEALISLPPIK